MSAKWIRSKQWDDKYLRGPLLPVKWLLRAFSSITLAVILLVLVCMYGVLASVPLGLLALIPTWLVYALTLVLAVGALAVVPTWLLARYARSVGAGHGARFTIWVLGVSLLSVGAAGLWRAYSWPVLRYDPAKGTGLRFFGSFVDSHASIQFRRLPGVEMSELEFYSWWPLSLVLGLFIVNLVVATLRRIEFDVPRIGVITVHTGIVTIALGSIVYAGLKQEGDTLLASGGMSADGTTRPGPVVDYFYDNNDTALWISESGADAPPGLWEQRRLSGVPRYNDYNLKAVAGGPELSGVRDHGPLDVTVPEMAGEGADQPPQLAEGVRFRVVGYANYAELERRWVPVVRSGEVGKRLRDVEVWLIDPDPHTGRVDERPRQVLRFVPEVPAQRVDEVGGLLGVEYTFGMDETRWRDLQSPLPAGTTHALVVEHPESGYRNVFPIREGVEIPVGTTGYRVRVKQILPEPPFPIITKGFEGARSSVVVARVIPPRTEDGAADEPAYERWVYHRYPELAQDLVDAPASGDPAGTRTEGAGSMAGASMGAGMPSRRDADPAIRLGFIDASIAQVYFDERPIGAEGGGEPSVRALVRLPGAQAVVTPSLGSADDLQVAPKLKMRLGARVEKAALIEFPRPVEPVDQDKRLIGTHQAAALAVEIVESNGAGSDSRVVWLPFTQYLSVDARNARPVTLSDGRVLTLAFGRVRHQLPRMALRLADFEMTPYPHSQTPRDYRSDVVVMSNWNNVLRDDLRRTSLNEPLLVRVPFHGRQDVPTPINWLGKLMSFVIPVQYKFSQAGWDQQGWRESAEAAARGELPRAHARFTILGVGNNPGIYVIATGAVMMSVGIPWAFYLKPVLMKRKKRKLQMQLAREGRLPAHLMRELGLEPPGHANGIGGRGSRAGVGGGTTTSGKTMEHAAERPREQGAER